MLKYRRSTRLACFCEYKKYVPFKFFALLCLLGGALCQEAVRLSVQLWPITGRTAHRDFKIRRNIPHARVTDFPFFGQKGQRSRSYEPVAIFESATHYYKHDVHSGDCWHCVLMAWLWDFLVQQNSRLCFQSVLRPGLSKWVLKT